MRSTHWLSRGRATWRRPVARVRRIDDEAALCVETAGAIADGLVIGWFQGRMEWGPRALGNRSILGDPRRADMKDILNLKIKRRESFRPFAPSVLREAVPEWFELDGNVPFMMQVYPIRAGKRARIPAVTHVDGTGRLQTVTHEDNPRYYALIRAFRELTGVPMVLNTSFNENEPVVCRPEEALDCFLRTRMDVLVLEDVIIRRGVLNVETVLIRKALITGITRQDGAYLAEFLHGKGYEVHGIKRRASSFNADRIDHLYRDPHESGVRLNLHYGDLTDATNLIRVVQQVQREEIYNLAAQSHVAVSFETPEYTANAELLDTGRAHSLGWHPTVSLRDGIAVTNAWYCDH